MAELERELQFEDRGQIYARECSANAWYAIGALFLRDGRREAAEGAFGEALGPVPAHPLATVGRAAASGSLPAAPSRRDASAVDASIVQATVLVLHGTHDEAALVCGEALRQAEPGQSGWLLPVEPLLHPTARPAIWAQTLATLLARAM
jgi:hypothetical protein